MSTWSVTAGSAVCFGDEAERVGAESLRRGLSAEGGLGALASRAMSGLNKCTSQGWGGGQRILVTRAEVEESVGWS